MPTPYSLELAPLAAAYAAGTLTPVAVVRDVYAAIAAARANPIWIHLMPEEEAIASARALGHRKAAGERFPLYGAPFAVKDNIDVAGQPTTAACPAYAYEARETAHAVQRLEDAGAILIGKTNLDQFATGLTGTRSPYGACVNPFNPAYIAGGSSAGSALAVACGLVSFALGTDTAGSGRVPAGFTNTVGLKPTRGLVSNHGVVPACRSLDCVSIFALTSDDAHAVFEIARGFDCQDIYSRRSATCERASAADRFRCGLPAADRLEFFGDATARAAFESARATLVEAGAEIVEVDFAPFSEAGRLLYDGPWVAERYAGLKEFLSGHAADLHPVTREVLGTAFKWSAADAFAAIHRLRALRRRCEQEWAKVDVLAVPTTGTIYTLDEIAAAPVEKNNDLGYYTNFVNLLDLAAIAVPGPFRSDGLPTGITFIAPAHSERMLTGLGARFHRASRVPLGATGFESPLVVTGRSR